MTFKVRALLRLGESGLQEAAYLENSLNDVEPNSRLIQILDTTHDSKYRLAVFETLPTE